jgi:Uncharacterized protein conserved in bacteria
MAERIIITPQELNDGAVFLKQRLASITDEVRSIQGRITDIIAKWEGASQAAFVSQWETEMFPILRDTLPQVIEGVAAELDAAANTLREADSQIAQAFKG